MRQKVLTANGKYKEFDRYICGDASRNEGDLGPVLLVCDKSFSFLPIYHYFEELERRQKRNVVIFNEFEPNPRYESVVKGVQVFRENHCRSIIAVGGGSAIDVAKCIKLYAYADSEKNYLMQAVMPNSIRLAAVPTTAGTGSEATRFAVVYLNGEKQSIADDSCIPGLVLLDSSALRTLPEYQRKCTMLDALCHGIESFWSVNSTEESKRYSQEAIGIILTNKEAFLANTESGNANMLYGAHLAGKAINITQTTAGHAMSYKLTGLYGIAHGHAAALCVSVLWPYMFSHQERCVDMRGRKYLDAVFKELAAVMGCEESREAAALFEEILQELKLEVPVPQGEDFEILKKSVNPIRLKNNPVKLDGEDFDYLYRRILRINRRMSK